MVKTTKDVYIPAVQNSLSQAKLSLKNYYNSYEQTGENAQHDRYFSNMEDRELHLVCYPSYTRIGSDKEYITQVRGCVYAPGQMNRRNRLVLSICKQLIRPTATAETEKELESVFSDDIVPSVYSKGTMSSLSTVNSSTSSSASSSLTVASGSTIGSLQQEEVLRERLSGFLNKSIPNVPIIVDLLDDNGNQETEFTSTDCYGHFQIHKKTNFLPRLIRVIVDIQSPISTQYDTNMVEDAGIAVISDIDDTIKHTGVVGDKRSMFCNVFVNSFSSWLIPGMSLWYNTLKDAEDVDFFYVSNSPYQIYPTLRKYVSTEYPMGPMFLKQYAGNMLCSLISSSAKLKIPSIAQICKDFPNKKFILVGDSGEEDLEAYISTARTFPKQIIGIYIRCCKDSMSDDPMNDWDVMEELNYIISEKYLSVIRRNKNTSVKKNPPPVPPKKICLPSRIEEEIRRSRLSKLSLPTASTASSPVSIANNNRIPSVGRKFAYEESNTPSTCTAPPPLPPRHSNFPASLQIDADSEIFTMPSTQNDYGIYSSCFDRKADQWKERVIKAINILQESKVDARFVFFKDPDICIEDSIAKIRSLGRGR